MNRKTLANFIELLKSEEVSPRVLEHGRQRLLLAMKGGAPDFKHATFTLFRPQGLRWAVSLAVIVVTVGIGVVAASQYALPGDVLYAAKRASERVRLALVNDVADRVALQAEFFDRRLEEAQALVDRNDRIDVQDQVRIALNESYKHLAETQTVLGELLNDRSEKSRAAVNALEDFAAGQEEDLDRLSQSNPSLRSSTAAVSVELLEIERQAALSDTPTVNNKQDSVVDVVVIPSDQEVGSVEGDGALEYDPYAEIREKAEIKIDAARVKRGEALDVLLELRDIERDEDSDAVSDLQDRFNEATGFLDKAERQASEFKDYTLAFGLAVDALKILKLVESGALDLIDRITPPEEVLEGEPEAL